MTIEQLIALLQAIASNHPNATVAFSIEDECANFQADIAIVSYDHSSKKVILE